MFVATNSDIHFEDFELTESLCSDSELRFGSCEPSEVKFQIRNSFIPLIGKWIKITETLEGNADVPFQYGRYKVFSDVPTADKDYRDIAAYDAMYDIINSDVAAWYNSALPEKNSAMTLRQFREKFLRHFGLEWVVPEGGLVNDEMTVERTIEPEQISGKDVITAICEINGCFGHIGRDGKFYYIYLPQAIEGLYPSNTLYPDHAPEWISQSRTGHLYPQSPKSTQIREGKYITVRYEDFRVKSIDKLQIRQEENDIGLIYGSGENCYIIQDNFLVYGKSSEKLEVIASNIFSRIIDIAYHPYDADVIGNPCFEVGDPVRFPTRYELVESYILERTLKGIQALTDTYSAKGTEVYAEKVNSIHKSIVQLKGKTNVLTRTIEETKLEMEDIGEGLLNEISITAGGLTEKISDTKNELQNEIRVTAGEINIALEDAKQELSNEINITASGLRGEINDSKNGLQTQISANANGLSAEITRAKGEESNLSTRITANASGLAAEITRAQGAEGNLSTRISATADGLAAEITRANAAEEDLSTKIIATAGSLEAEVSRATKEEGRLSGRISLKPDKISMTVSNESTKAGISISLKDENGNTVGSAATGIIQMTGLVKFTDLSGNGTTTINGSNIKTGTIDAERINTDKLKVNAANITGSLTIGQLPTQDITTITENTIKTTNVIAENLCVKSANIQGKITADSLNVTDLYSLNAKIGGFTIGIKSIYNGTNSLSSTSSGIYLGTDGFRNYYNSSSYTTVSGGKLTTNNADITGNITATSGHIGSKTKGFTINDSGIYSGKTSVNDTTRNGIYVGADGIACGSSVTCYKATSTTTWTRITKPSFQVTTNGDVFIGNGAITVGSNSSTFITDGGVTIVATSQGNTGPALYAQPNMIKLRSGNLVYTDFTNSGISSVGSTFSIKVGGKSILSATTSGYLGFFGTTPATKQTVSTISSTSSATSASNATKINEIINALKKYGLL